MNPYISIIATTRNDNHGGEIITRTQNFLESLYVLSGRYKLPVEIVVVEWNPPDDKERLFNILKKPDGQSFCTLRIIEVPKKVHHRYKNAPTIPLFQMIAKNVGIRRASGEFVLCTNVDIIFSDSIFEFFSKKKLTKGVFYRANRCDVPKNVVHIDNFNEKLQYCKRNIIRRLGLSQNNEALRFLPFQPGCLYFSTRFSKFINKLLIYHWKSRNKDLYPYIIIDFEACGDFTLMSKQDWMDIEGYVELDMYSIHIDSMALWSAIALGKKQFILSKEQCVYHIDHENGWESEDVIQTIKFLENKPSLDYSIVEKGGKQILREKRNWNINKPDWGFANEKFKEYIFEPGKEMREVN